MPNAATLAFIRQHASDDVRQLALRRAPEEVDLRQALQQIEGRQLAARKLPAWAATDGLLFPPRLALEQCSSEATSHYKRLIAERILSSHSTFADLTAGFGVDFAALAPLFAHAIYVERHEALCQLARHNLPLLGLPRAEVRCAAAEDLLEELALSPVTLLFLDPARRDAAGRKVALIEDCTPDVCALQDKLRTAARFTLIKLSPMLDLTAALRSMRNVAEAHVVAVDGECKELLLLLAQTHEEEPLIHCVFDPKVPPLTFKLSEERACTPRMADRLELYLYEPDASILKAGAFKLLTQRFPVRKLSADTHLYTSDLLLPDFPGRKWQILDSATFAKSDLRRLLAGVSAADLTLRGFPGNVATLRKQLHLREGGPDHFIATTLSTSSRLLLKVARIQQDSSLILNL